MRLLQLLFLLLPLLGLEGCGPAEGEEPPSRVGALVLSDDERAPKHATSDASRGYAYFSSARATVPRPLWGRLRWRILFRR